MKRFLKLLAMVSATSIVTCVDGQRVIFESPAFKIFSDRVEQGNYIAKAASSTQLESNYQSPANLYQSADISFKFAINGRDNEMLSGVDHHFTVNAVNGEATTPVIIFGKQLKQTDSKNSYLQPDTKLTIKLDMREVMQQFKEQGFYTSFKGDKIYKEDFKGVYVAGNTAPMMWDFDNLVNRPQLQLHDTDGDGIYETTLLLNSQQDVKKTDASWKLSKNTTAFPQYHSTDLLADALYNMSLEEMIKAVEPDSTFRTGKEWAGVWTRDISYSIILSMAYLQPQVAKNSLMRKVNKRRRIIQDTGTGGAWPASTDRMIWAVAAFEIYKSTGDEDWLRNAYEIIKNTIDDDRQNVYDVVTGMVKGESSFLDWREQTYPRWMQPADIFESECLGTNAVHYQANTVLSQMALHLHKNEEAKIYKQVANRIKNGINKYFWQPAKGYYGQYLYGRKYKMLSSKSEALGEALSVVFDIADSTRQKNIVQSTPITDYGISCIYPQIPGIPPYHNNAVWPFVQTYWLWAGAKAGNETSVLASIAAIYRPAALFLTNKENFVADNGDFNGTQINSSNMLWSLSGNLSLVHKVLFGIHFNVDNLSFSPFVPKALAGERKLTNFTYRNAVLDITVKGFGNRILSFLVDGKRQPGHFVQANISGHHTIEIELNNFLPQSKVNLVKNVVAQEQPLVKLDGNILSWQPVNDAKVYRLYNKGKLVKETTGNSFVADANQYGTYQITTIDDNGIESFATDPIEIFPATAMITVGAETVAPKAAYNYQGANGNGFIELSKTNNTSVSFNVNVVDPGNCSIDFRYANGNGPTNTENKCAIRSLAVDNRKMGTIVLPQRGKGEWSNWGYTNAVMVKLAKGKHTITLSFEAYNENMNEEINQAMLDELRLIKL